jgi:predicted DNA-binding protein YlxM (UPF0122 family)
MSVIGLSPSDIANGARLVARGLHSLKEDGGAKQGYQQVSSNLESRLAALDQLEKFALSSGVHDADDVRQSIFTAQRQANDESKQLERYNAKLGLHGPKGKRRAVVDKLKWEFKGEQEALSHSQRTAPGFEALLLKSIV